MPNFNIAVSISLLSLLIIVHLAIHSVICYECETFLFGTGNNNFGQLGLKTTNFTNVLQPVTFFPHMFVKQIAPGENHTWFFGNTAIDSTGNNQLFGVGDNSYGQLGNGGTNNEFPAVSLGFGQVPSLTSICTESINSFFRVADGTLYGLGRASLLGAGLDPSQNVVEPKNLGTCSNVYCGRMGTFVKSVEGTTINVFGDGTGGELGINFYFFTSPSDSSIPNVSKVKYIATGGKFTLVLMNDGEVYGAGSNSYGQLCGAVGGFTWNLFQNASINPGSIVVEVAAGLSHSLLLTNDGLLYGCGNNENYELTSSTPGTKVTTPTLISLSNVEGAVTKIHAGDGFSIIETSTGKIYGWGLNNYGQTGTGVMSSIVKEPTLIANFEMLGGKPFTLTTKFSSTFIVTNDGNAFAFGANFYGKLNPAISTVPNTAQPIELPIPFNTPLKDISTKDHSLLLTVEGEVYCSGNNEWGQCADGTSMNRDSFVKVNLPEGKTASLIAAGTYHSLILANDGTLYSVGANTAGQLGNGTYQSSSTFVTVDLTILLGKPITQIAAGNKFSVILSDGKVFSFGDIIAPTNLPTLRSLGVLADVFNLNQVAAGNTHAILLSGDGRVFTFGDNAKCQLGIGNTNEQSLPVQVTGFKGTIVSVSAGGYASFAINSDGEVFAWGTGYFDIKCVPEKLDTSSVNGKIVKVKADTFVSFVTENGDVYNVGQNEVGQLGLGGYSTSFQTTIAQTSLKNVKNISVGIRHGIFEKCLFRCGSYLQTDPRVCNGKGSCIGKDKCVCNSGYYGDNCEKILCYQSQIINGKLLKGAYTTALCDRINAGLLNSFIKQR